MKILVAGSCEPEKPEFREFRKLNYSIGQASAESGHTLIVGSVRERAAECHALAGLVEYASRKESGSKSFRVEFFCREGDDIDPPSLPKNVASTTGSYAENPGDRRLGARAASVGESDGVICVGGSRGTQVINTLAESAKKRVIGLPQLGGAGEVVFQRVKPSLAPAQISKLKMPLKHADSFAKLAKAAIDVLEKEVDAKPFTYFISYSQAIPEPADHVEVLLRSFGREVLRDLNEVSPGDNIDSSIKELIAKSNTFVGLFSNQYNNSGWCMDELKYARSIKEESGIPLKIVLLLVDDEASELIPEKFKEFLHLDARERAPRELAIRKIIESERKRDSAI